MVGATAAVADGQHPLQIQPCPAAVAWACSSTARLFRLAAGSGWSGPSTRARMASGASGPGRAGVPPAPGNDGLVVVIVIIAMSPPATTIPATAIIVIVVGGTPAVVVSAATGPATEEAAQQPTPTPRAVIPVVSAAAFQETAKLAEHRIHSCVQRVWAR